MTVPIYRYADFPQHLKDQYRAAFPNPEDRAAWALRFGPNLCVARWYHAAGIPPRVARAWNETMLDRDAVLYLYAHGHHDPDLERVRSLREQTGEACADSPNFRHDSHHAAALLYAHPNLPIADAVALIRSGLTPDEAHHAITTRGAA